MNKTPDAKPESEGEIEWTDEEIASYRRASAMRTAAIGRREEVEAGDYDDPSAPQTGPGRGVRRAAVFAARKQILGGYQPRTFKPALTDEEFEERQADDLRAIGGESIGGYVQRPRAELPHKTPTEEDQARISEKVRDLLDKLGQDSDGSDWGKLNGQFLNIVDRLAIFRLQLADVIEPYQARAILSLLNERKQKLLARKEEQAAATVELLDRADKGDEEEILFDDLYDLFVGAGFALAAHPDCETNAGRVRDALQTIEEVALPLRRGCG
jgi:hypothetical protein